MSKENEAFQQRRAQPQNHGPNPGYQHPQYQGNNGQQILSSSSLQPGPTYNTIMPGACAVPGPVSNPAFQNPGIVLGRSDKSVVEAYLLWLIFGLIGGHHFYLGRYGFGVVYFFTFGLCGAGFVIDMFRMPYLVSMANKTRRHEIPENNKNISDAYTLWFPMGILGYHHHYLGNHGLGVFYLFTVGGFGIGWLIDLFRIPYMVREYNNTPQEKRNTKSVCTAYALAVSPAGILGFHHFYLRRYLWGILYFCTFGLVGVGWIVDWFRIPVLVKRANQEIYTCQKDQVKHLDDAYTLWFPLGLTGIHHLYLERYGWALLHFLTFGLLGLGWLIDGCRMSCLVKEVNKRKEERRSLIPAYGTGYVIAAPYTGSVPGAPAPPVMYPPQQPGTQPMAPPPYQQTPQYNPSYVEQPPPYTQTVATKQS